jgi:DNA invertase Pin-like site-specific DNA recombinase
MRRAGEQPIDTSTAAGKCFLDMLGVFAEFETNLRRERQLEGIAKAKTSARDEGGGQRSLGNREGPQDRPGVGLSGAGSRLGNTMSAPGESRQSTVEQ